MAIMIPNRPHSFTPASLEGVMFTALEKLPDDYYVFHSLKISTVRKFVIRFRLICVSVCQTRLSPHIRKL